MAGVKSRRPNLDQMGRWIRDGYGQGQGLDYKPFMYVRDVPSTGLSSMVHGRVTGRVHHYFSDLEISVHLLAEHDADTVDIREQYALLPWDETQEIARRAGIRHPTIPGTKTPSVMTTDIVVTKRSEDGVNFRAVSVKPSRNLTDRTYDKLWIEKAYWDVRGVPWNLVTEEELPRNKVHNLRFFEGGRGQERLLGEKVASAEFVKAFKQAWRPNLPYLDILSVACNKANVDASTGHALMGWAVWNHVSPIDIDAQAVEFRGYVKLLDAKL